MITMTCGDGCFDALFLFSQNAKGQASFVATRSSSRTAPSTSPSTERIVESHWKEPYSFFNVVFRPTFSDVLKFKGLGFKIWNTTSFRLRGLGLVSRVRVSCDIALAARLPQQRGVESPAVRKGHPTPSPHSLACKGSQPSSGPKLVEPSGPLGWDRMPKRAAGVRLPGLQPELDATKPAATHMKTKARSIRQFGGGSEHYILYIIYCILYNGGFRLNRAKGSTKSFISRRAVSSL